MENGFDVHCKKTLLEIRDFLKSIDQKISHLIEQNRMEREMFFRSRREDFEEDEDD